MESHSHGSPSLLKQTVSSLYDTGLICMLQNLPDLFLPDRIMLIQIGGLGVMTLTSFFAMFFMGNTSLYNQLVVRDMVSSQSLLSLIHI